MSTPSGDGPRHDERRTPSLPGVIARLACLLGWHDFRLLEADFSFGAAGGVEKLECRRCGHRKTRRGR